MDLSSRRRRKSPTPDGALPVFSSTFLAAAAIRRWSTSHTATISTLGTWVKAEMWSSPRPSPITAMRTRLDGGSAARSEGGRCSASSAARPPVDWRNSRRDPGRGVMGELMWCAVFTTSGRGSLKEIVERVAASDFWLFSRPGCRRRSRACSSIPATTGSTTRFSRPRRPCTPDGAPPGPEPVVPAAAAQGPEAAPPSCRRRFQPGRLRSRLIC